MQQPFAENHCLIHSRSFCLLLPEWPVSSVENVSISGPGSNIERGVDEPAVDPLEEMVSWERRIEGLYSFPDVLELPCVRPLPWVSRQRGPSQPRGAVSVKYLDHRLGIPARKKPRKLLTASCFFASVATHSW